MAGGNRGKKFIDIKGYRRRAASKHQRNLSRPVTPPKRKVAEDAPESDNSEQRSEEAVSSNSHKNEQNPGLKTSKNKESEMSTPSQIQVADHQATEPDIAQSNTAETSDQKLNEKKLPDRDASRRDVGPPTTDSDTTSNSPDPEDPCADDGKQPQITVSDDGSESGYDSDLQGIVERVERSAEDIVREEQIWGQLNFTPAKPHDSPKILRSELDAFSSDLSAWVHGRATKRRKVSGE